MTSPPECGSVLERKHHKVGLCHLVLACQSVCVVRKTCHCPRWCRRVCNTLGTPTLPTADSAGCSSVNIKLRKTMDSHFPLVFWGFFFLFFIGFDCQKVMLLNRFHSQRGPSYILGSSVQSSWVLSVPTHPTHHLKKNEQ